MSIQLSKQLYFFVHNSQVPIVKLAVVESYLTSKLSYRQIALQYGMNNPSLIARWKSDFMKYGANAFVERPKGRIPTMSRTDEKAKITTHTKSRNQKKKKELTPE